MEEKTIEVVVDGVTIPLEEEEKEFLKRRFSVEQPGKRRKLSSGPPQVVFTFVEGAEEEEIRRKFEAFLEKRRRRKLNTTNDE
jgi:hypothetical protein